MKITGSHLIIIIVTASVISVSGCLNSAHFENSEISFDYPYTWNTGKIFDLPGAIIRVSESSQVDVKIYKNKTPPGSSLKEVYDKSVSNTSLSLEPYCYIQISNKTITVDGREAYENVFQIGCNSTQTRQIIREVWLEKNGSIYTITCTVIPPEDFQSKNSAFDLIINSFHAK